LELEQNKLSEKMSNKLSTRNLFFIGILLILIDQATKVAVKGFSLFGISHTGMSLGDTISIIGDTIQIAYVENAGMAFGITFGSGKIFLSLFSIIASFILAYLIVKMKDSNFWVRIGFILIFAGATGNLIDRVFYGVLYGEMPLFYGHVVDFIQVDIPDIDIGSIHYTHFPIFNIADSCVTCGVIVLILAHKYIPDLTQLLHKKNKTEESSADATKSE
jgi:signal peptidase II